MKDMKEKWNKFLQIIPSSSCFHKTKSNTDFNIMYGKYVIKWTNPNQE